MELLKIDASNWETAAELTTNADGRPTLYEEFVASSAYSMLEAFFEPGWRVRLIAEEGEAVGFAMYGINPAEKFCEISRLLIDRRFQGWGYGRRALQLLLEEIRAEIHPEAVYISAEPENERALHLYRSMGFADTGRIWEGERLLCMKLNQ